jgi:hypothetical protein
LDVKSLLMISRGFECVFAPFAFVDSAQSGTNGRKVRKTGRLAFGGIEQKVLAGLDLEIERHRFKKMRRVPKSSHSRHTEH